MLIEQWKDILGYEGYYQVSNQGKVKRLKGLGCSSERILKTYSNKQSKYLCVSLCKRGMSRKIYYVHQLVLESFVGPRPPKYEARHLDGSRNNNLLDNLKYGTRSENMKDRVIHGTHFQPKVNNRGIQHGRAKLTNTDIFTIRQMLISGRNGCGDRKYTQTEIAKIFNVQPGTISKIKLRKRWQHLKER